MATRCHAMPVVELSLSRLVKLVGKTTKKQISDFLPFLGLDVESQDGDLIRVEYSPNRPDYSTDYGIALGLQGLLGIKTGIIKLRIKKSKYEITVTPKTAKIRPYVTCVVAKNGVIDDKMIKQLMSMQEDLHFGIGRKRKKSSIGIHDLDKIVFPLTYTCTNRQTSFTPLNSDKEMQISQILSDTEMGREFGHLFGNSPQVPIIYDAQKIVSLPPIINANVTAVTNSAKNLLVEVTGINKKNVEDTLAVIATILQSAGFSLESVNVHGSKNSTPAFKEKKILLEPKLANSVLGLNLNTNKMISSLRKCRLDASCCGKKIQCVIPAYRFDIFGEMDLVEEIILGYGIKNIDSLLSAPQTLGCINESSQQLRTLSKCMVGLGYLEALNSSLTSRHILYEMTGRSAKSIAVKDSKSQEHVILRDLILPQLLENLSKNIHEAYPQKLFETGTVFGLQDPVSEKISFSGICAHQNANFTEIKSVLQSALQIGFGLEIKTRTFDDVIFEDGHCASVVLDGKVIGTIGKINSGIIEKYKIRVPVVGFEISLDHILV